jgi:predicted enzyme related to lactoylglutathione lyase
MHNAVNWFEIPVVDFPRAVKFYEATLAGKVRVEDFQGSQHGILPYTPPGVGGALVKFDQVTPSVNGVRIYLAVGTGERALDAAISRAREAGGLITLSKTSLGDIGWIGIVQDSEGNSIGLHSERGQAPVEKA